MSTTPLLEEIEGLLAEHDRLLAFTRKLLPDEPEDPLADALRRARDRIAALEQDGERLTERWTLLRDHLLWVLPMAKGYAKEHPVGRNQEIVNGAQSILNQLGDELHAAIAKIMKSSDQARRADGGKNEH